MKFTIEELETKKNGCKRKLANEILESNAYKRQITSEEYKELELASQGMASIIINDFLNDNLISNGDIKTDKPFGINYCKENNLNIISLIYESGAISWQGLKEELNAS